MKNSNEKTVFEKRSDKTQSRLIFINELVRRRRNEAGAGILALVALHFVSQFILFPEENFLSRKPSFDADAAQKIETSVEPEPAKQSAPNQEPKKSATEIFRDIALSNSKTEPTETTNKIELIVVKKKIKARELEETRGSRAARLRRAERLLTGN